MHQFQSFYIYGMKARPFSIGCQPMDGLITSAAFEDLEIDLDSVRIKYHSTLLYDRKLSEKELDDYELDFLGITRIREWKYKS